MVCVHARHARPDGARAGGRMVGWSGPEARPGLAGTERRREQARSAQAAATVCSAPGADRYEWPSARAPGMVGPSGPGVVRYPAGVRWEELPERAEAADFPPRADSPPGGGTVYPLSR